MLFLLLAIICSGMFAVVFKFCQIKQIDTATVLLFNFVAAFLFSAFPVVAAIWSGNVAQSSFALSGRSQLLSVAQGFLFFGGFSVMNLSVSRNGVGLTTIASRTSLLVPLILSWALLSQPAPSWPVVGLLIVAMLLIVLDPKQKETRSSSAHERRRAAAALALVFLFFGFSDFHLKVVQNSADTDLQRQMQMTIIFLAAVAMSLVVCFTRRNMRLTWKGVGMGAVLGLFNVGCTACMLRALARMSTDVYYPLNNIGIVIFGVLAGLLFFREKIKPLQIAGLVLAVGAIALMLWK